MCIVAPLAALTGAGAGTARAKMQSVPDELPHLLLTDADAWRSWLEAHNASSPGVWLRLAKKGTSEPTAIGYGEALDEALCHGWIDGQVRRFDALTYVQRFTPRRPRSAWSQNNVARVQRLREEGRLRTGGLAVFERALADGRIDDAYPGQASIEVPDDLLAALQRERALEMFAALSSQNRYAILLRVSQAKRADTRARRIERLVAMLHRGETIHPQRRRPGG